MNYKHNLKTTNNKSPHKQKYVKRREMVNKLSNDWEIEHGDSGHGVEKFNIYKDIQFVYHKQVKKRCIEAESATTASKDR